LIDLQSSEDEVSLISFVSSPSGSFLC